MVIYSSDTVWDIKVIFVSVITISIKSPKTRKFCLSGYFKWNTWIFSPPNLDSSCSFSRSVVHDLSIMQSTALLLSLKKSLSIGLAQINYTYLVLKHDHQHCHLRAYSTWFSRVFAFVHPPKTTDSMRWDKVSFTSLLPGVMHVGISKFPVALGSK